MQRKRGSLLRRNFVLVLLMIFGSLQAFSQDPIPTIPNVQDPGGIPQIDRTKLTNSALNALLIDKNRQRTQGEDQNALIKKVQNKSLDKDSTQKDNIKEKEVNMAERTYGYNVFQGVAVNDISELSTPPLDYPIGVGDHIIVALWGKAEFQEDYVVARDGSVFPAGLGKIYLQGMTFENARSILMSRFLSVTPDGTQMAVSIGAPRSINVNVVGEVNNPGPQVVSSFSNAFYAIAQAGGVTDFGNLRSIEIKRGGKLIATLDVYKYLNTGELGAKVYLQNNDFVVVGFYDKKVLATGQFKRPMYYQLKKGEGLKALLKYSGGLNSEALASTLKVLRSENEKQVQHDVNANAVIRIDTINYQLQDGDVVKVELIKPGITNKVEVKGEVNYPGIYELRSNNLGDNKLFALINRAGGVTSNTYLQRAYIFRGAGDSTNLKSDKLEVNLSGLEKNDLANENNITLQANDVVQLFTQSEFGEQQMVEIYGEVRKPGKQKKYGGMTLQDLLYLSGGIKPSAEYGRLEISSIVDIDSAQLNLKPTRTVVKSYKILSNLELDSAAAKIQLKPYDQIFVRKNPTFELQQNVTFEGLIKYPGLYPRLNKYEKLSSYVERAGGLKDNADINGAILYRNRTSFFREAIVRKPKYDSTGKEISDSVVENLSSPVSIDLFRAMKYKGSKHDIVLQEGDVIYVPEINPFVTVGGTVQSPLRITFDKEHTNLTYYIDKAGGFGVRPWKKRVYVKYASGKSKRTKNFFFMHFYPRVEQGCTIEVPTRPEGKEITDVMVQAVTATIPIILSAIILKYINK